jgi:hypothetical protein
MRAGSRDDVAGSKLVISSIILCMSRIASSITGASPDVATLRH